MFAPVPEENFDEDAAMELDFAFKTESSSGSTDTQWALIPKVDESNTIRLNKPPMERFIGILDQIDSKVEQLRKDAVALQEKQDFLHMSVHLMKNNEYLSGVNDNERDEIFCYAQRIGGRLSTVQLTVCTIRDKAQEDSLHQINRLIDTIISSSDCVIARQKCQQFLNACSASDDTSSMDPDSSFYVDKKFETALLGCTMDDQKRIKKRLQALLTYLTQQTVVH